MNKFSLKTKIILAMIAGTILLALILSSAVFWYLNGILTNEKIDKVQKLTTEQVHESTQIFEKHKVFAKMLGTRTRVMEFLLDRTEARRKELLGIFSTYTTDDPRYLAIYLLDKNGKALISTDPRFVGQDYGNRIYFQEALAGRPAVDASIGKTSKQFGYYFAYPVFDNNKNVLGVLAVKVDKSEIDQALSVSEISKDSTVMLADQFGVILFSTQPERTFKSLGVLSVAEKDKLNKTDRFLETKIDSLQYDNVQKVIRSYRSPTTTEFFDQVDKETELVSIVGLANLPFFVVSEIGVEDISSKVLSSILIVIIILLLGLALFTLVIVYLIIGNFLKPLFNLNKFVARLNPNDEKQRAPLTGSKEVVDLAYSFNKALDAVAHSREEVNQKVVDQTREIQEKAKSIDEQSRALANVLEDVEAERDRVSVIIQSIGDAIFVLDEQKNIILVNSVTEQLSGYTKEQMVNRPYTETLKFIFEADGQVNDRFVNGAYETGQIQEMSNHTFLVRKDGTKVAVSDSASPIKDDTGRTIGCVVVFRDVTREREIDRAKTEFVSLASHQLKTPVGAVRWDTEMLLSGDYGELQPTQKEVVTEIHDLNLRMGDLVRDFLNISRIELGTFMIEPSVVKYADVCDEVLVELKERVSQKGHTITKQYQDQMPETVADPKLLHIIFQNLLSNAVKYTPDQGRINVSIQVAAEEIIISVANNGLPISKADQAKIFNKLFRAQGAQEMDPDGNGLGLYLLKSVVESAGGKVWFESEEGKDTVFSVSFPLPGMKKKEGEKRITAA